MIRYVSNSAMTLYERLNRLASVRVASDPMPVEGEAASSAVAKESPEQLLSHIHSHRCFVMELNKRPFLAVVSSTGWSKKAFRLRLSGAEVPQIEYERDDEDEHDSSNFGI
ncbi:MAG: hypothetical protein JOZ21_14520 [Verrucomicrobia bacterium]|jgi:hypothetical protein|nr:hypothetical protein [Verrucomicrobiota bacterium]